MPRSAPRPLRRPTPRPTRREARLAVGGLAALTLATALLAAPVQAHDDKPAPSTREIASGLDNPRLLSFGRHGRLYVAEAGAGGTEPCFPGPEGDEVCYGDSGAVTRVVRHRGHHHQKRVVEGLPSVAAPDGSQALGPADVAVRRRHVVLTIGLGADPALRAGLPEPGRTLMGTIATGHLWKDRVRVAADLAAHEAEEDPDGLGPDSNPTGLLPTRRGLVATDSGANALMRAGRHGWIKELAVFDSPGTAPNPFDPSAPDIEVQPVPTSVAIGPDGAFYVSELTGFPFVPGLSRIHRVVPGMPPTVYATGLTNVTDLAWHHGELYAVQLADDGLLSAPPGELPTGSLLRVDPGGAHETVAGPLPAPYGVAMRHHKAYITTCSVCPGAGSVVKVPLGD